MKRLILAFLMLHISLLSYSYSEEAPKRIVSLAPNMTEILFALGLGDRIVGVTSFCDYPEEAKKKTKVGGMSNPSLEAVISLKPDVVVMTTDGNPKEFEERLRSVKIRTYVYEAKRIAELPQGVRDLGKALGVSGRADAFAQEFEASLKRLGVAKRGMGSSKPASGRKVIFVVWPEPLIVAGPGTVIDDALAIVGADNIAAQSRVAYPKYSIEEIIRRSPDVIIIGRGMQNNDVEKISAGLLKRLKSVPAVKNKRVFYVSDDLYRLGPRTIRGIEEISKLVDR